MRNPNKENPLNSGIDKVNMYEIFVNIFYVYKFLFCFGGVCLLLYKNWLIMMLSN